MPGIEQFVHHDGIRLRYLRSEPQDGRATPVGLPVVLVPGIVDTADDYVALFDLFAPRHLVVVDLRGRGRSDAPPSGYSAAEQSGDVDAVLAAAGIDRFHLMTFSRGTTPALEVALRAPGRVATLSIGDYLAAEVALPETWVDQQWESRWRGRPMPERVQRHVLAEIQRCSRARDLSAQVAALAVPTLVARGGDGAIVTDEHEARYRASIPGVEVVTIPGAGHDLFRPDRLAYGRAVLDLIARRAPGT